MTNFLRNKSALLLSALLLACQLRGQEWTFFRGATSAAGQTGVYGTQGTAAATNLPGAHSYAATWTDNSGNLWFFGGGGYGASAPSVGGLSDLWKYTISTNQWTWMKGPSAPDVTGTYGTQGVAAAANNPGGRQLFNGWTDNSGNFWIYGGYGWDATSGGTLNDLWKYDVSTNQWTWMHGSNAANAAPVYGTQGTAAAANTPGAKKSVMTWTDSSGDLWLFGGSGTGLAGALYNDLWKYTISTNQWTWVGGTNLTNQTGVYGTIGAAAAANVPGARTDGATWTDNSGNLWLFGGNGYGASGSTSVLNDLWKYNIASGQWTWIGGANTTNQQGVYGTMGIAASGNMPGARAEASKAWKDSNGNLWLFGGTGYASGTSLGKLSDVWKYSISTNQWTWMKGANTANQTGIYGTAGVSAASNAIGARTGFLSWVDNTNTFWVMGGSGYHSSAQGYLNDLWRFTTCNAPATPTNVTTAANQNVCSGGTATLSVNAGGNAVNWYASAGATTAVGTNTSYVTAALGAGSYTFYAEGFSCMASTRVPVVVTAVALPTISAANGTVCSGHVYTMIPTGAGSYTFSGGSATVMPSATSSYSITGSSVNGCPATNTAVIQVSVSASPTITVNSGTICAGHTFTLNPSGAATYSFYGGGPTTTVSTGTVVTYSVTGTSSEGCVSSNTAIAHATVMAWPALTVAGGTLCSGSSFTIHPSGVGNYTFSGGSAVVSPPATSSYTVTGSNAQGCESLPAVVTLTVVDLPTITFTAPVICSGQRTVVFAHGAYNYSWSTGSTADTIAVYPSVTTTYTVIGTSLQGCSRTATVMQVVDPCTGLAASGDKRSGITVFPNPANGQFTIGSKQPVTLKLINELGQVVRQIRLNEDEDTVMISDLKSGVYVIVNEANAAVLKKVIVIR